MFSVAAELAPARVPAALDAIAAAVARLALLGPTDDDLERARTLLRARWARRLESMEGRASALAAAEALDGYDLPRPGVRGARRGATRRRARGRGRRYLQPDAVSGGALPPARTRAPSSPPTRSARAFAVTELRRRRPRCPRTSRRGGPATARLDRHAARGGACSTPRLPGADLLVRPQDRRAARALSGIYVPRRRARSAGAGGLGALTVRSAVRGAGDLDAGALAFAFERLGGTLSPSAASDWLGFGTSVLAEHLAEAAGAAATWCYTSPRLDERGRRSASAG